MEEKIFNSEEEYVKNIVDGAMEKVVVKDGVDGVDGINGVDGKDGVNGIDGQTGEDGKDGQDGKDGSPDTPIEVRDKLETLKGEERLDKKAVKGLEDAVSQVILDRAIGILDSRTSFLINKVANIRIPTIPAPPDLSTYVVGPASATDNAVALYNTSSGKIIKNSDLTYLAGTMTSGAGGWSITPGSGSGYFSGSAYRATFANYSGHANTANSAYNAYHSSQSSYANYSNRSFNNFFHNTGYTTNIDLNEDGTMRFQQATTCAVIGGDPAGCARGNYALDIQSKRSANTQVASGNCSVAFGMCNTASGIYSTALGSKNLASGANASVMGYANCATAVCGVSYGICNANCSCNTTVIGNTNSAYAGSNCTTLVGRSNFANTAAILATAIGVGNQVHCSGANAFGFKNCVYGATATAAGAYNTASSNYNFAVGYINSVSSPSASAFGVANCVVAGGGAFAFGSGNVNCGYRSYAFGSGITASGYNMFSSGLLNNDTSTYGASFGVCNTHSGYKSAVFGTNNTNARTFALTYGRDITATSASDYSGEYGVGDAGKMRVCQSGVMSIRQGQATNTNRATAGGTIFDYSADAGNTTTTETDLYSSTLAANVFGTNKDKVEAEYGGVFVSSATATRQIKIYFAGTAFFDTGALTLSLSSAWTAYVSLIRVSSTVVRYMVSFTTEGAALAAYTAVGELTGLTLSGTNILKITGQAAGVGAATNDVVAKMGTVSWWAAG